MIAPHRMPVGLTINMDISARSPRMMYFMPAFKTHVAMVPSAVPMGTAILHQFRASSLTKWIICRLLAQTAQHPEKLHSLGHVAVHAAGDHHNSRDQNHHK